MRSDIHVFNIQIGAVRAKVSTEVISNYQESAPRRSGLKYYWRIFFDGDLKRGGSYEFTSSKVTPLRIPGTRRFVCCRHAHQKDRTGTVLE
jgi:hypothetical protein